MPLSENPPMFPAPAYIVPVKVPLVAVIAPVMNASVATRTPDGDPFPVPHRELRRRRLLAPKPELSRWEDCPWQPSKEKETV